MSRGLPEDQSPRPHPVRTVRYLVYWRPELAQYEAVEMEQGKDHCLIPCQDDKAGALAYLAKRLKGTGATVVITFREPTPAERKKWNWSARA